MGETEPNPIDDLPEFMEALFVGTLIEVAFHIYDDNFLRSCAIEPDPMDYDSACDRVLERALGVQRS